MDWETRFDDEGWGVGVGGWGVAGKQETLEWGGGVDPCHANPTALHCDVPLS